MVTPVHGRSGGPDKGPPQETVLPYRGSKGPSKSSGLAQGTSDLKFLESLQNAPENVLGSLVLTGMLTAKDMRGWAGGYKFKFDSSTSFELCEDSVMDLAANQDISFLTTDEKTFVKRATVQKLGHWQRSARYTSAAFTFIDFVCITMTFFEDYSQASQAIARMHEAYKFTSIAVWFFLLYARNACTEDAIERMKCILESISGEDDLRMVDVAMSHIGFCLSYNLSKCSMFYLYGRGGPGLITTGMFLISTTYLHRETGDVESDTADCSDKRVELVALSAIVLSFITALSWSKAKLLYLFSTQIKSSLDHLNSLFQTNLTKASMDKISDPDFMVDVLSDQDIVHLPDLLGEDCGREFLGKELEVCTNIIAGLINLAPGSSNKYLATFRAPKDKTKTGSYSNRMNESLRKSISKRNPRGTNRTTNETKNENTGWQEEIRKGTKQGKSGSLKNYESNPFNSVRMTFKKRVSHRSALKKRNSTREMKAGNEMDRIQNKLANLIKEDGISKASVEATEADILKRMDGLLSEGKVVGL